MMAHFSTMAFPFETCDTILTQEQADHINERHVFSETHPRTSKFKLTFNLSTTLAYLATKTWDQGNADIQLIEHGWKEGHGRFYLYVFAMSKIIGKDPEGFPARHIAMYFPEKKPGDKWAIISAYPFTRTYHAMFLCKRKPWLH